MLHLPASLKLVQFTLSWCYLVFESKKTTTEILTSAFITGSHQWGHTTGKRDLTKVITTFSKICSK